jgi:hypothetical protein
MVVSEVLRSFSNGHLLNPAIAQFLMQKKGDAHMKHTSRILLNRDTCCGGTSPLYLICKKYLQIILHEILLAPTCVETVMGLKAGEHHL